MKRPVPRSADCFDAWFAARGWQVFEFQKSVWREALNGRSGLLHASTGAGKTYAVWFAALKYAIANARQNGPAPLRVLWITPMRALASDTLRALSEPLADVAIASRLYAALGFECLVGARTGDTGSAERARQTRRMPFALVTTPESLTLLLTRPQSSTELASIDMVVVDEWHELMGNKRGVQTQLALARLRRLNPNLLVWGVSATLGNLEDAMAVLVGESASRNSALIQGQEPKILRVDTLLPSSTERFPWGGHLGLRMLQPVICEIEASASSLVFTNTRSQAELWYQALLEANPHWAGLIALHHGSLDKSVREWVELGLKEGRLKAVVCTSSLDLGVDFSPVERVLQIGSPKGVARLLQRAGRSGHSPGRPSRVSLVPTNALELLESAAVQDAILARRIEARHSPQKPLDVLVQHLVTIALGTGFKPAELLSELRDCHAYRDLSDAEFQWALDFVTKGGQSLWAYPEYHRVVADEHGIYRVPDPMIAKRHRMSVGTIVADASMQVKFLTGKKLGAIEESFVSRLRKGDQFLFGGRLLEFVRVHEMSALVRHATRNKGAVPRWNGGKMPLSSEMADAMLDRLERAAAGELVGPEMLMLKPLLDIQARWSALPTAKVLVAESLVSRDGHHLFLYPFAGRHVHIGLASLLAWRAARTKAATFSIAVNDYGFEMLSPEPVDWSGLQSGELFDTNNLLQDIHSSLNSSELALRRFREVSRVSGLVFQGHPGAPKSTRQLQASASLFFEVFRKHDPENLLLTQAQTEVLQQELDLDRLTQCLLRMAAQELRLLAVNRATPFAFPLLVERLREQLSTEKLSARIERMLKELELAASP